MFHKSVLGVYGEKIPCDLDGFVPEEGDRPESFRFGHTDFLDDFDELGNGYFGAAEDYWGDFVWICEEDTKNALYEMLKS